MIRKNLSPLTVLSKGRFRKTNHFLVFRFDASYSIFKVCERITFQEGRVLRISA